MQQVTAVTPTVLDGILLWCPKCGRSLILHLFGDRIYSGTRFGCCIGCGERLTEEPGQICGLVAWL